MANILIVDNEEQIRDSFQFHFRSIGWLADVAKDGQEAMDILTRNPDFYNGMILDKNMPGASGDQVVQWLYNQQLLDDLCVVLLTGYGEKQSVIDALRMGVWQYLEKDMTPSDLHTFIAPGIALKKVHRLRRELVEKQDLKEVLGRIHAVVKDTLAPDAYHVIFLSPFLSRDLSDGTTPSPSRRFVKTISEGKTKFLSARTKADAQAWEPVLPEAGTLVAVPVKHDHGVLGVLEMESRQENAFDPRWKEVLICFAEVISLAQEFHEKIKLTEENAQERAKQCSLKLTYGELGHRIGTSLSVIQQSGRDLQAENLPESARLRVSYINSHTSRINDVLLELKDLTVVPPVNTASIDVGALLRSIVGQWRTRSDDVEVILELGGALRAQADEGKLADALACLIKNAFEAIDERRPKDKADDVTPGYWIRIDLYENEGNVIIRISDHGIGFDEEIHARLFNPLFSTKNRRENLNEGYGLYTSERVIKAMGGSIEACSPGPYEGASFTIRLRKSE